MQTNIQLPFETKKATIDSEGLITAYASTFGGPPDTDGDVFIKGAFASAIAQHKAAGTMPHMFLNHDQFDPVGVWYTMSEDDHGLRMTGKVSDTTKGKDARILLADGAIKFSIGFYTAPGGYRQVGNVRYISKVARLVEASLVAAPANHKAGLVSMKAADKREFEHFLRDVGMSRKQAKKALAGDWGSFAGDGEGSAKIDRIIDAMRSLTNAVR